MKYLEITYGDNDFCMPVTDAVRKVWDWIYKSNHHCLIKDTKPHDPFSNRTMAGIFRALDKAGVLQPMIKRTYQIEYFHQEVEYKTRGLYWTDVKWKEKMPASLEKERPESYLDIELQFRNNESFMSEWNNGEGIALNLETGEIIEGW